MYAIEDFDTVFKAPTISEPMGALCVDNDRPYCFAKANLDRIWVNWKGPDYWTWTDLGLPTDVSIKRPMGTVAVIQGGDDYPYTYFQGTKGGNNSLYLHYWTGKTWEWEDLGNPSDTVGIDIYVGSTVVDNSRPYLFCLGQDDDPLGQLA